MRLSFLGPRGTNGEEAALRYAPDAELVPLPSHALVAAAVDDGRADAGVLAIENLITGSVIETLDVLIHETDLQIEAEIVVPIVHNLIVKPGTPLSAITVVFSHPQALGQCRKFLEVNVPQAKLESALSTAQAVELVMARAGDSAAVAPKRAADLFGGQVAVGDVGDAPNNVTRFVILGHGKQPPTGRDRTSIAFWFRDDRAGSLASVLNEFARRGINCTKIESRPTRAHFREYIFLVDFDAHQDEAAGAEALAAVRSLCSAVKVFGSFPRSA